MWRWWWYFLSLFGCGRVGRGLLISFLATTHCLARKYFWRRTVEQETDLAGLNSQNLSQIPGFGGPQFPKFLFPPRWIPTLPLIWIETKTLALKVYCGHLACQRSGPSLPLYTHRPTNNSQNLYSGIEMYLGPTWILYKLVGNFAMTGLIRAAGL